jgi:hypothetical protein
MELSALLEQAAATTHSSLVQMSLILYELLPPLPQSPLLQHLIFHRPQAACRKKQIQFSDYSHQNNH